MYILNRNTRKQSLNLIRYLFNMVAKDTGDDILQSNQREASIEKAY